MTDLERMGHISISVVVCTYNRGFILKDCIASLRAQDYDNYDIIVVAGPCTDNTAEFLQTQQDIRTLNTSTRNLSVSRNLGIDSSDADVVAFIDDDGIAAPDWLSNLAKGYRDPQVGGVGGLVYDHTGMKFQYRYSACYRNGLTLFSDTPFGPECVTTGANPFVYLQGTNASFRRSAVAEIGGFNERIEYFHDETDVCCRILDAGYKLVALNGAIVFHKYAQSATRDVKRIVREPFAIVKNQHQFALHNGSEVYNQIELMAALYDHTAGVEGAGHWHFKAGDFSRTEIDHYKAEIRRGVIAGFDEGRTARPIRVFDKQRKEDFRPLTRSTSFRGHICFVSNEYPPGKIGGIGRYTYDLATQFAKMGIAVHVVTKSEDFERVDFEEGVWVHRVLSPLGELAEIDNLILGANLALLKRVYEEVLRIHSEYIIDVVCGPIWLCEALLCSLDPRFTCVLTLMTTLKTIYEIHPSWSANEQVKMLIALEEQTKINHEYIHAISRSILDKTDHDYGQSRYSAVMPLGAQPHGTNLDKSCQTNSPTGRINVLFVGRLERRKGIDILLEAVVSLLRSGVPIELTLVGADTHNTELGGATYKEVFQNDFGQNTAVSQWVHFEGEVDDQRLVNYYKSADIFCLPSRFESFGLVLVEAMSYGIPLVAARCGGMVDIVEDQYNGLMFDPEDAQDLMRCLQVLVTNRDRLITYGINSKKTFEEKYSIEIASRKIITQFFDWSSQDQKPTKLTYCDLANMLARMSQIARLATGLDNDACFRIARIMFGASVDVSAPTHVIVAANTCNDPSAFIAYLYVAVFGRPCDWDLSQADQVLRAAGGRAAYVASLFSSPEAQLRGISSSPNDDRSIWQASLISDRSRATQSSDTTALYIYYFNEMTDAADAVFGRGLYRLALRREPEFPFDQFQSRIMDIGGRASYLVAVVNSAEGIANGANFDAATFMADAANRTSPGQVYDAPAISTDLTNGPDQTGDLGSTLAVELHPKQKTLLSTLFGLVSRRQKPIRLDKEK